MPNRVRNGINQASQTSEKTCYLLKDLYDCVRNRPFDKTYSLIQEDGRIDRGLKTEQDMKDVLWKRNNPFLHRPVTFRC